MGAAATLSAYRSFVGSRSWSVGMNCDVGKYLSTIDSDPSEPAGRLFLVGGRVVVFSADEDSIGRNALSHFDSSPAHGCVRLVISAAAVLKYTAPAKSRANAATTPPTCMVVLILG